MAMTNDARTRLRALLAVGDDSLPKELAQLAKSDLEPADLVFLNKVAASYQKAVPASGKSIRVALIGGYTLHPFVDFLNFYLAALGFAPTFFVGEYDNYTAEILSEKSLLAEFKPDFVFLIPSERRHTSRSKVLSSIDEQRSDVGAQADEILLLCQELHKKTKATVLLANFVLPNENHFGPIKHRGFMSDWVFRKSLNTEIGLRAESFTHIVDAEFISASLGVQTAEDRRAWYESKQLGSMKLLQLLANETAHQIANFKAAAKKVIVLDLDNTLWGGVIGDDDIAGIELGDTSPRGEAFKDFQRFIRRLKDRGFLLAVCSKNEEIAAKKPFLDHPDMVLKLDDIVNFKANWSSKADNINEIAKALNLSADSMVFIDDNPAEIAMVNQFMPQVSTIQLTTDPADFIGLMNKSGFFHQTAITSEDLEKTQKYKVEGERSALKESVTDMESYLRALEMRATIHPFTKVDAPRISQLINKSNQFNLTTRRRSEAEILALIDNKNYECFTVRLEDRFGDYGLIAVVICENTSSGLTIDTLLMSCRVLERGVEQEIINKIERIAQARHQSVILGDFIRSAKNAMVKGLYEKFGFETVDETEKHTSYRLLKEKYQQVPTAILVQDQL